MTSKRLPTPACWLVMVLACVGAQPAFAQITPERTPVPGAWGPNGTVNDSVVVGDTLFLGGNFDYIGPPTGAFATTDAGSGASIIAAPAAIPDSFDAASDGAGGWFVASGPYNATTVRHIRTDGSIDTGFTPPVVVSDTLAAGLVRVVAAGDRLYITGSFVAVNGVPRRGIAALDPGTGQVLPWDASVNSGSDYTSVARAAVDGNLLYIAGYFTTVSGQSRPGMAVLDAQTGALLPATFANTDGKNVFTLSAAGGRVYVMGGCSPTPTTSAQVCAYTSDGTPLVNWGGVGSIYFGSMLATPSRVYISGTLSFPGFGNNDTRVRGFDPMTGAADGWQTPRINDITVSGFGMVGPMVTAGGQLFISGDIVSAGGVRRFRYAGFDTSSGALTAWQPAVGHPARALASDGARIALAGSFISAGGRISPHLAALDVRTGLPSSAALPSVSAPVYALASSGTLVVAGAGPEVVAFSAANGAVRTRFDISAAGAPVGTVRALAIAEPLLFVGGNFVDVLGEPRRHLAAIDMRTGRPTAFDPQPDNQVFRLRVSSGALYAVGAFSSVPGYGRGGVAAWNIATGALEAFNPPVSGVTDLAFFRDRVLLAGALNGSYSQGTAWVDRVSGGLTPLGRPVPFHALGVARTGNTLVVGGNPSPAWRTAGLVALDGVTGAALPWGPLVDSHLLGGGIQHVQATDTAVIVTGLFNLVDGAPANNLAIFRTGRAASPRQMTAAVSNGTVSIGWQPGVGPQARSYVLEAGTTTGASDVGTFAVGAVTRVTGVLAAGTSFIRVRGVGDTGPGPAGSEVIVSVPSTSTPPSAPGPLTASVSAGVVTLTWGAATGNATSYVIEAGTAAGLANIGALPTGNLDTTWSTFAPSGTYYVRVRAANAFGLSAATNDVTVVVP